MPEQTSSNAFPGPEALAEFFQSDRGSRVAVPRLARLLGAPAGQVREVLRAEGVPPRGDSVSWGEAAAYLFDAWPRARIIEALGPELAAVIPPGYHPVTVQWRIPAFIVHALEYQAALMRARDPRRSSLDDYVADILFNEIDPATVAALAADPVFIEAYSYPPVD